MAALLARIVSLVTIDLAQWLIGFIVKKYSEWQARSEQKKADEAKNKQVREQTAAAQSRKEREDALKNELRNS